MTAMCISRTTIRPLSILLTVLVSVACLMPIASAHDNGTTGYAKVTINGRTVEYALTLSVEPLPPPEDVARAVARTVIVEADGARCEAIITPQSPQSAHGATVSAVVLYACRLPVNSLRITDGMIDVVSPRHHTITDFQWAGGNKQVVFEGEKRVAEIAIGDARVANGSGPISAATFFSYFGQGVEHILLGFDHVLFVLVLILPGGTLRSLLAVITAFTVAHSITLALSVLGIFTLPARLVEPVIALSIAYVAFENLYSMRALTRRWTVSFVFGLVHGFGFAGALAEIGLPASGLTVALVGFNLGVEAGQALLIALALPVLISMSRSSWQRRGVQIASVAILVLGLGLLTERVFLT